MNRCPNHRPVLAGFVAGTAAAPAQGAHPPQQDNRVANPSSPHPRTSRCATAAPSSTASPSASPRPCRPAGRLGLARAPMKPMLRWCRPGSRQARERLPVGHWSGRGSAKQEQGCDWSEQPLPSPTRPVQTAAAQEGRAQVVTLKAVAVAAASPAEPPQPARPPAAEPVAAGAAPAPASTPTPAQPAPAPAPGGVERDATAVCPRLLSGLSAGELGESASPRASSPAEWLFSRGDRPPSRSDKLPPLDQPADKLQVRRPGPAS